MLNEAVKKSEKGLSPPPPPLENAPETPLLRENRLYQADHLLREYAFEPEELVFAKNGNLPLSRDPKLSWALAHPERFPVEAATADRGTLLRVPGLGPRLTAALLAHFGTAAEVLEYSIWGCHSTAIGGCTLQGNVDEDFALDMAVQCARAGALRTRLAAPGAAAGVATLQLSLAALRISSRRLTVRANSKLPSPSRSQL